MKRIYFICLLILLLLFLGSCRENLMDVHHVTGDLSVTVSINESLYQGTYIQDGTGRFVGPSSDSVSLTYTVGDSEYTTSLELALSADGNRLTGTATLKDLPAGVEGLVNVSTYDVGGSILCDGEEVMVLSAGNNQTTLTLSISDLCPFLKLADVASFLDELLSPGGNLFIKIPGLTGGARYDMHVYQEMETPDPPDMAVITTGGTVLDITELDTDNGGLSFILPQGEDTAIICFYNPHSYAVPGLLWVDRRSGYNSVTYGGKVILDELSISTSNLVQISAGEGKFFLVDQSVSYPVMDDRGDNGRIWISDNLGSNWDELTMLNDLFAQPSSLLVEASVTDILYREGTLYSSIYHLTDPDNTYCRIGHAEYRPSTGTVTKPINEWKEYSSDDISIQSPGTIENQKICVTDTTIFMVLKTQGDNDEIVSMPLGGGTVRRASVPVFATSMDQSIINELQLCGIGDVLYLLGDQKVFSYKSGSSTPVELFSLPIEVSSPNFRYLTLFKDKYIIASNGENSYLYFPETKKVIQIIDYEDILQEVQIGYGIKLASTASNNYVCDLTMVSDPQLNLAYMSLSVSANGGFDFMSPATLNALSADLPSTFLAKQIVVDDEEGIIYVGGIANSEGYEVFYFTLQ